LETLRPESLIPFRIGVPCTHDMADSARSVHGTDGALDLQLIPGPYAKAAGGTRR
jgi:hypothetical protein